MSWGIKITILYLSFVGMIVTMVVLCMGQTVDLESKDYYAKELAFQGRIDAAANANALENTITHDITSTHVVLKAPVEFLKQQITGEVVFFRPSDASKDVKLPLVFSATGEQTVDKKQFINGVYKMQLSWQHNNKNYYKEAIITIKK